MNHEQLTSVVAIRAADARAIILPFVLSHSALLVVLGFAGAGLEDSGVQLSLAAFTVLGSLWSVMWLDDCMADIACGAKDLPADMADTHMGRRFAKAPFGVVRVVNVVIVTLIVVAELMAIY